MEPMDYTFVDKLSVSVLFVVALDDPGRADFEESLHRCFLQIGIGLAGYDHAVVRECGEQSECFAAAAEGLAIVKPTGETLVADLREIECSLGRVDEFDVEFH